MTESILLPDRNKMLATC